MLRYIYIMEMCTYQVNSEKLASKECRSPYETACYVEVICEYR